MFYTLNYIILQHSVLVLISIHFSPSLRVLRVTLWGQSSRQQGQRLLDSIDQANVPALSKVVARTFCGIVLT